MTTTHAKYAVDLANDGVALWHCNADKPWQLLGQVALNDQNFSKAIEQLKTEHGPNVNNKFIAQIRIPRSEIFVSDIDLADTNDADITSKVHNFLTQNTPYSAQDLVFDLSRKDGGNISYVAAISKQTIGEAKDFILGHGFEAEFYTTKLDKSDFPEDPCFYDSDASAAGILPASTVPEFSTSQEISVPPPPTQSDLNESKKTEPENGKDSVLLDNSPSDSVQSVLTQQPNDDQGNGLNTFATKRNKALETDDQTIKTDAPVDDKEILVPPPPTRISIDVPNRQTSAPVKAPIKTPQGGAAKTDVSQFFKLRYMLFIAAFGLIALLIWFYTALTDGKDEISLLQQIPSTEPFVISELQSLKHKASLDAIPTVPQNVDATGDPEPSLRTPETLDEPTLYTGFESIQKSKASLKKTHASNTTSGTIVEDLEKHAETQSEADLNNATIPAELTQDSITESASEVDTPSITLKQDNPQSKTGIETVETAELTEADSSVAAEPDLLAMADPDLKSTLPKFRPPSIVDKAKEAASSLLALADPELANIKPKRRPASLSVPKEETPQEKIDPLEIDIAIKQAVSETLRPRLRPKSLSKTVARLNADSGTSQTTALISPATSNVARGTSKPSDPSPANIQKEATERAKVSKSHMSLIGVFGKPSARQALLRMPSGRFVKVKPGQRVSGWKVAAIGESSVRITKGSRNQVLRMPK